jgi:hypothetical protein
MDAMQKRRMWKVAIVAIAHFLLTLFVLLRILNHSITSAERDIWLQTWGGFWSNFLRLLQPQILILGKLINSSILSHHLIPILILVSVPIWSICFGWLLVELDNWLNHFPVLSRKVF